MPADPRLTHLARINRKSPTIAESMLWADLRSRRLGFKFRRQQSIGWFIVDFVCFEKRLVVEVDGWTHTFDETFERDQQRQAWLESQGYRVVRFDDQEVLADRAAVVDAIYTVLHETDGQ